MRLTECKYYQNIAKYFKFLFQRIQKAGRASVTLLFSAPKHNPDALDHIKEYGLLRT